jgi:hypothetical protein
MVTLVGPEKLNDAIEIVATPLAAGVVATAVGWVVSVGALVAVAVGLVPPAEELPPQAASSNRQVRTPIDAQNARRVRVVPLRRDA